MNHPKLIALFAALCMSQGCIFAESEVTPGGPAADQGQVVADMGDALDQSAGPDLSAPDLSAPDLDPSPDQGGADMPAGDMDADMGADMACPSVAAQCVALQVECGQTSYPDQCDLDSAEPVQLNCGDCKDKGDTFSCQENKCVDNCMPLDDDELCKSFACGRHEVTDCGVERDITCPDTCNPNTEVCVQDGTCCDELQQRMAARPALINAGKCGAQPAVVCERDATILIEPNCNEYAMIMGKEAGYYQCDAGQCVCKPESDQELCDKLARQCGPIPPQTRDRCGVLRQGFMCAEKCTPAIQKCCPGRGVCVGSLASC